jgi:hypothetical protein
MSIVCGGRRRLRKGVFWAALLSASCAALGGYHCPLLWDILLCFWASLVLGLRCILRQRHTVILCAAVGFLAGVLVVVPAIQLRRTPGPTLEHSLVLAFCWLVACTMIGACACEAILYMDDLIGKLDWWLFGTRDPCARGMKRRRKGASDRI